MIKFDRIILFRLGMFTNLQSRYCPILSVCPRLVPSLRSFHALSLLSKSAFRASLRPDLLENRPHKINRLENQELWKKKMTENSLWWMAADPDKLEKMMTNLMATISYKLPNGGFRPGIVKILLKIATAPSHLRVAQQAISIMQNKDITRKFDPSYAILMSKAAVRIRAPEMGLSFIRMPWINMWPTEISVQLLLEFYAKEAEELFLNRMSVGEPPLLPQLVKEKKKDEEEEEEEEEVKDDAAKAKAEAKILDTWLTGFTETYKELRSDRHRWNPSVLSFSMVIRFYAAVGDVNAAIQLMEAIKEPVPPLVLRNIMLALVHQGRATEALKYKPVDHPGPALPAVIAVHLALQDYSSVLSLIKGEQALTIEMCKIHFGVPDRIKSLRTILQTIQEEGSPQVTEEALQYIQGLPQVIEKNTPPQEQTTEPQPTVVEGEGEQTEKLNENEVKEDIDIEGEGKK